MLGYSKRRETRIRLGEWVYKGLLKVLETKLQELGGGGRDIGLRSIIR